MAAKIRTDVELLHQIVLRAQQRHDVQKRPKRALFEAYEKVFAENGLDTKRDRACLRIILQLGEPQIPGDLLYDRFEFVLRQMGVSLAFGDDDDASAIYGEQYHGRNAGPEDEASEKHTLLQTSPRRPTRRISFTSMYDVSMEQSRKAQQRQSSRASETRLQSERVHHIQAQLKGKSKDDVGQSETNHQRRFSIGSPDTNRHGMRSIWVERSNVPGHPRPYHLNSSKIGPERPSQFSSHAFEIGSDGGTSPTRGYPQELFYRPSDAQLDRDADAFDDMRLRNLQRRLLRRWVLSTRGQAEHVQVLELQAESKDFFTLKKQALDFWRTAYQQKLQQFREERFFEHLYNRAGQAYRLYLLTKSFTHWIQITAGAVARTNAARQRFLFTKYFNAWYRFTVANELKAERQELKAPLNLLRRRAAQYYRDQVNALELYHGNLTKYVFWRWFRQWCDRAAPRYREQQLQRRVFNTWLRSLRMIRSRETEIDSDGIRRALTTTFRSWATKARIDVAGYHQADAFRKSHLLRPYLTRWHVAARLTPIEDRVSRMRDWRIARSNFSIWQIRVRMVFRADAVNTMRTLQNAFSAWNEQLRVQALASRINERIVAESVYGWVIAQRCVLMSRISEQYRKRRVLEAFLAGIKEKWNELSSREDQLVKARQLHLLGSTLGGWQHRKASVQANWQIALNFYIPKLRQDTLEAVRLKVKGQQKLEAWAKDARFYFLMTRHVSIWRTASSERKKSREKAVHAQMRRKCKMNLARNVLHLWTLKRRQNDEASDRAGEVYGKKLKGLQQILLRDWHEIASRRQEEVSRISNQFEDRLLEQSLGLLVVASRHLYNMQSRAEQLHHLKLSETCSAQLRRFSMRAFEIRRREQDADAMHERHWTKHVRNMIRHWASKTQDTVYKGLVDNAPDRPSEREPTDAGYATASNEDHPHSTNENELGVTRRAEEWTAFDTDLLEGSEWIPPPEDEPVATSTPMPAPGYLNTPSKRAARAKAIANLSTTPATPLRTPFAARLRAGAGSSPSQGRATTARRDGVGFRSALGSNMEHMEDNA
jgi:protein SFI1